MTAQISFFPVGNVDMTLVQTEGGHMILIDMIIRSAAKLRDKLTRDAAGRLYVDALRISYPDDDHCRSLLKHFHLGPTDK